MRFCLLDRVTHVEPGRSLTAIKALSLAEEYLADHFPGFPVLPGVLMLEAMTQAGAWLVRVGGDFDHSLIMLRQCRNVKYSSFVKPSQTLVIQVDQISQDDETTSLKAQGKINDTVVVSARLVLGRTNLADTDPDKADIDALVTAKMKELWTVLWRPEPITAA